MMDIYLVYISVGFSVFGMTLGMFLFTHPSHAIELQKKFYAKINWKIEPISMEKEVRNTRMMGLVLLLMTVTDIAYTFFRGS